MATVKREQFQLRFTMRALSFDIEGDVAADALTGKPLDSAMLRSFMEESAECRNYMQACNTVNLMKIREIFSAYLTTQFPSYTVTKLRADWQNGEDVLTLRS
jgi:hypothetical protein